jgi:hypothetical protein
LLKSIDLLRHRIDGDWKQSGNQLSVSPGKARLRLPFRPGDQSYDLHIGARRDYGADALIVGLVFQGREFLALIDRDEATLLSQVDGQRQSSEAQWRHRVFKQGQFADIVISVREDRLSIVVNNATVATWTDYGRLSANPDWNEGVGLLLLASNDSAFTFSKIIATQPSVSSINAVAASANLPASTSAASLAVASNAANAATSGSFAGVGKPSTGQKPAPAEAARSKAQASFQQVYESKLKQATRPADKAALARELANQARSATGDPADHYVLLAEARRLAAEAGDTTLAIELITELERYFQNDYWPSRVAALTSAADHSSTPEARHAVLTTSLELAEQAAKQDDYQSAVALSGLAVGAANSLKDAAYIKAAKERQAEYKSREKLWEQASQARDKLKDAPDDPSANLIWGKYLCLMRNDWESGVKLLAKGSDTRIREAAELELAQSNTPETRAQAGDSWFAAAEANKSDKQAWLSRSKQWYEQAAVQLATAERARVEKRIGEINEQLDRLTGGKARAAFPLTGLVGKVFVDNKDVNLVIHYQPGKTFSSQVVKDLLARYNIKGKAIQIRLSGALRLLSDTDTNIYVGNNGVPIGNVLDITGTERHRIDGSGQNGRYSKFEILRKGDYLISWTIGGTTIEDCSMSLEATQQNWQPLPIVHTQGMLDSMRARRARAEVDVSIN